MSGPCSRPECGGEVHTDGWGSPVRCPHAQASEPEFVIELREDDGTLIVGIHPDGQITTGPRYQPDAAAAEFWDAVTRATQAANPLGE